MCTVTSERLPVMRRIADQLTEAEPMEFENSFGGPTSSLAEGSAMHRVDRTTLAEAVADELEQTLDERLEWWRGRAADDAEAREAARAAEATASQCVGSA